MAQSFLTYEQYLNNAYRWFLGYGLKDETPHFSTISYNFRHRFNADTIDKIFAWILSEAADAGYLKPEAVFIDVHFRLTFTIQFGDLYFVRNKNDEQIRIY